MAINDSFVGILTYVSRRWGRRGLGRGLPRHDCGKVATQAAGGAGERAGAMPAMAVGARFIIPPGCRRKGGAPPAMTMGAWLRGRIAGRAEGQSAPHACTLAVEQGHCRGTTSTAGPCRGTASTAGELQRHCVQCRCTVGALRALRRHFRGPAGALGPLQGHCRCTVSPERKRPNRRLFLVLICKKQF